jgi:hypothetical protein
MLMVGLVGFTAWMKTESFLQPFCLRCHTFEGFLTVRTLTFTAALHGWWSHCSQGSQEAPRDTEAFTGAQPETIRDQRRTLQPPKFWNHCAAELWSHNRFGLRLRTDPAPGGTGWRCWPQRRSNLRPAFGFSGSGSRLQSAQNLSQKLGISNPPVGSTLELRLKAGLASNIKARDHKSPGVTRDSHTSKSEWYEWYDLHWLTHKIKTFLTWSQYCRCGGKDMKISWQQWTFRPGGTIVFAKPEDPKV